MSKNRSKNVVLSGQAPLLHPHFTTSFQASPDAQDTTYFSDSYFVWGQFRRKVRLQGRAPKQRTKEKGGVPIIRCPSVRVWSPGPPAHTLAPSSQQPSPAAHCAKWMMLFENISHRIYFQHNHFFDLSCNNRHVPSTVTIGAQCFRCRREADTGLSCGGAINNSPRADRFTPQRQQRCSTLAVSLSCRRITGVC